MRRHQVVDDHARGKFVLSINGRPEIREWFNGFVMEEVWLKCTVSSGGATEAAELIISNVEARVRLI